MKALIFFILSALSCSAQLPFGGVSWYSPVASGGSSPAPDLLWYKTTENTGNPADSSGHANTGIMGSGSVWAAGPAAGVFSIAGGGANTGLASTANVTYGTNKITVCMWVKASSFGAVAATLFSTSATIGGSDNAATCRGNDGFGESALDTSGGFAEAGSVWPAFFCPTAAWHHLACFFDNSAANGTNYAFVDASGVALTYSSGATGTGNFTASKFYIDGFGASTEKWTCAVADVRVYSRLLSASEVTQVFNDPK